MTLKGLIQDTYDALGRVARRRAGGNATPRESGAGDPEWIGAQADGATVDTAYRYDWDGELVESWDRGRGKTEYRYDPIGQLLAMVLEKVRKEVFRYDPAGNIFESVEGAQKREYEKGNRLQRKGNLEYRWDDDGRLIEKRAKDPETGSERLWEYRWNGAGLLKAVDLPDGRTVEFAYDPFARRVQKRVTRAGNTKRVRVAVSETRFVWEGDVLVHEITTSAGERGDPVVAERTYCFKDGGFAPVAHREVRRDDVMRGAGWFHYVNDPIGTPERLIGGDGAVACELSRSAWGTEGLPGGKTSTPLRLQGQYADDECGLIYNRWRYLSSEDDLFCSPDPLGLAAGTHSYRNVWNSFSWMDPFGLATMREAEALLNASENRGFGNNVGHANVHIPPAGVDPVDHAANRGNKKNTVFRSRNQGIRALRDCMTQNESQINALPSGQTHGTPHTSPAPLSSPVEGIQAERGPYGTQASHVSVTAVSYNFGRLPNGDTHLLHFQPHGR